MEELPTSMQVTGDRISELTVSVNKLLREMQKLATVLETGSATTQHIRTQAAGLRTEIETVEEKLQKVEDLLLTFKNAIRGLQSPVRE